MCFWPRPCLLPTYYLNMLSIGEGHHLRPTKARPITIALFYPYLPSKRAKHLFFPSQKGRQETVPLRCFQGLGLTHASESERGWHVDRWSEGGLACGQVVAKCLQHHRSWRPQLRMLQVSGDGEEPMPELSVMLTGDSHTLVLLVLGTERPSNDLPRVL